MMMKKLCGIFLFLYCATNAWAGNVDSFGIGAKATAMGGAFSATADDPYAVYYNPAGLAGIERAVVSGGAMAVSPSINVYDYSVTGGVASSPSYPSNEHLRESKDFSNNKEALIAPHLGLAMPVSKNLAFGIAAYAPWGLEINWEGDPSNNPGVYNTFHSYYMRTVISPTVAYRLTDKLFLGTGISIGRSKVGNDYISAQTGLKVMASLEDDLNYSLNFGVLYAATERVQLGVTYRGRTETDFKGDLEIEGFGQVSSLSLEFDHPEQIQGGIRYVPDDEGKLSMEMDVVWTNWSINKTQTEYLSPPFHGISEISVPRNWDDTYQLKLGAGWEINTVMTLRGGYCYDPSPIPDETMDLVWPDADKSTYSLGLGVELGNFIIDAAVTYSVTGEKRYINGESESINGSYDTMTDESASVHFSADGNVWGGGITVSYSI